MGDAPVIELRPSGRKCGGARRTGGKCTRPAGWGTDHQGRGRCKLHTGSTPAGKAQAAMEGAREALAEFKARVPFYGNVEGAQPTHPFQVILDNVNRSDRAVLWLEGIIQGWGVPENAAGDSPNSDKSDVPDAEKVKAVLEGTDERPPGDTWALSFALPDSKMTGLGVPLQTVSVYGKGGTVHDSEYLAFLRLYQEERRASVAYAKIALDAGLDERMQQLHESQGIHMRKIIDGTLRRLGVEPTDEVAAIVLEEVRALNAAMTKGLTG